MPHNFRMPIANRKGLIVATARDLTKALLSTDTDRLLPALDSDTRLQLHHLSKLFAKALPTEAQDTLQHEPSSSPQQTPHKQQHTQCNTRDTHKLPPPSNNHQLATEPTTTLTTSRVPRVPPYPTFTPSVPRVPPKPTSTPQVPRLPPTPTITPQVPRVPPPNSRHTCDHNHYTSPAH